MTTQSNTTEPETGEQWLVDGATVYKLHIPHDPRYEKGRPCPENRLSFHVQQGRGVSPEEARQMARHAAYALNSVTELERERDALREACKAAESQLSKFMREGAPVEDYPIIGQLRAALGETK